MLLFKITVVLLNFSVLNELHFYTNCNHLFNKNTKLFHFVLCIIICYLNHHAVLTTAVNPQNKAKWSPVIINQVHLAIHMEILVIEKSPYSFLQWILLLENMNFDWLISMCMEIMIMNKFLDRRNFLIISEGQKIILFNGKWIDSLETLHFSNLLPYPFMFDCRNNIVTFESNIWYLEYK